MSVDSRNARMSKQWTSPNAYKITVSMRRRSRGLSLVHWWLNPRNPKIKKSSIDSAMLWFVSDSTSRWIFLTLIGHPFRNSPRNIAHRKWSIRQTEQSIEECSSFSTYLTGREMDAALFTQNSSLSNCKHNRVELSWSKSMTSSCLFQKFVSPNYKFWPSCGRVNDVYGDKNLKCRVD